jgi:hypothetical protein
VEGARYGLGRARVPPPVDSRAARLRLCGVDNYGFNLYPCIRAVYYGFSAFKFPLYKVSHERSSSLGPS